MSDVTARPTVLRRLWRELLLPCLVIAGLLLIAMSLVEGPPLDAFLYAVF